MDLLGAGRLSRGSKLLGGTLATVDTRVVAALQVACDERGRMSPKNALSYGLAAQVEWLVAAEGIVEVG